MSILDAFRERRPFPGQDPWVVVHDGTLLLVQTADANRRIVIKQLPDLEHMDRNVEKVIWAPSGPSSRRCHIWAPELHHIDGSWFVYYTANVGTAVNHRTYVLAADHPLGPYRSLGPIYDPRHDVWAIDLTVFTHLGRLYAVWSGWDGPDDGFPQNLYIAPMANPWTISAERRCLSRPEHTWEASVAPVNEGPTVIRQAGADRPFILYAADASWTQDYKTGLLEWTGGDVADPTSWHKRPLPFFAGGGHGCVVDTLAGSFLVYHRKLSADPGWSDREILTAPLVWDADGSPSVRTRHPSTGGHAGDGDGAPPVVVPPHHGFANVGA